MDADGEMTIKEVSRLLDVPESKLRYYEKKQLVSPRRTDAGYRMYSSADIARLRDILLLRYFDFSIEEIRDALSEPDFSAEKLIAAQADVQKANAKRAETLAGIAQTVRLTGLLPPEDLISREGSVDEQLHAAEKRWNMPYLLKKGSEFFSDLHELKLSRLKSIVTEICALRGEKPDCARALQLSGELYTVLCETFCPVPLAAFQTLARAYASEGLMAKSLDQDYGEGSAAFFSEAIAAWCAREAGHTEEA